LAVQVGTGRYPISEKKGRRRGVGGKKKNSLSKAPRKRRLGQELNGAEGLAWEKEGKVKNSCVMTEEVCVSKKGTVRKKLCGVIDGSCFSVRRGCCEEGEEITAGPEGGQN